MTEMETIIGIIDKVNNYLFTNYEGKVKLVLYTYDGLLFDFPNKEIFDSILPTLNNILCDNKYKVKYTLGCNYDFD
jgi:hypothetical protein